MIKKLFFIFLLCSLFCPAAVLAETFNFGQEKIVAQLEPERKVSWLIKGGNKIDNDRYILTVLSMDQVNALNRKYGGYNGWAKCNSRGSSEGMNSISTVILFTKGRFVNSKLENVLKLSFNSPVIEIIGSKCKIIEYTYNNKKTAFSGIMTYYLISDINVVQNKY